MIQVDAASLNLIAAHLNEQLQDIHEPTIVLTHVAAPFRRGSSFCSFIKADATIPYILSTRRGILITLNTEQFEMLVLSLNRAVKGVKFPRNYDIALFFASLPGLKMIEGKLEIRYF